MHRIIFFNDFLDDPTVRMLTGPLSSVGKKYSKNNKSGLSYFYESSRNVITSNRTGSSKVRIELECTYAPNNFF